MRDGEDGGKKVLSKATRTCKTIKLAGLLPGITPLEIASNIQSPYRDTPKLMASTADVKIPAKLMSSTADVKTPAKLMTSTADVDIPAELVIDKADDTIPATKMSLKADETIPATKVSLKADETISAKWTFTINQIPAINPKNLPQNLQFVVDNDSNVVFLVDTGSEISILPKQLTNAVDRYFPPQSRVVQGIGNGIIHPIGCADIILSVGDLDPIKHNFWVMQESGNHGIIGLDILMKHQLSISPATAELIEIKSGRAAKLLFPNELATKMVASVNKIAVTDKYSSLEEKCRALIDQFPEITREPHYDENPKHSHSLEIVVENYEAKFIKPRRCWGQRDKVERHFNDLCQRGVVERGSGETCASPVTCVKKKDGSLRVCVDYTRLNSFTRPLCYPLPKIDELSAIIPGGTCFFTNIDLREAYFSLPIAAKSRKYAAVITHNGVFVPSRCQFGLKNAPMRFQSMMESLLRGCEKFTYVYLDDILIYSKTEEDHLIHVKEVLKVLSDNGLFLNTTKSTFARSQLEFLGHSVGVNGIDVLSTKVQAIRKYPNQLDGKI